MATAPGGILSVALSVGLLRLAVSKHRARGLAHLTDKTPQFGLSSSDNILSNTAGRDRLRDRSPTIIPLIRVDASQFPLMLQFPVPYH